MSIQSAKAYADRLNTDPNFAMKSMSCKNTKERMKFAKSQGFDFTPEEAKQVRETLHSEVQNRRPCSTSGNNLGSSRFVNFKVENCDYC